VKPPPLVSVVDDDESVRVALRRLLTTSNVEVATFASGREFLDSIATRRPACLILDVDMPGMTGPEVLRALIESGTSIPVIVLAGRAEPQTEARCLRANTVAYLLKPIDQRILLDMVALALRRGSAFPAG